MTDPRALIDALFDRPDQNEWTDAQAARTLESALRAVLDLHVEHETALGACAHCFPQRYECPCPTVQVITKALEAIK